MVRIERDRSSHSGALTKTKTKININVSEHNAFISHGHVREALELGLLQHGQRAQTLHGVLAAVLVQALRAQ